MQGWEVGELGVPERKEVTRSQKDTGARTWQERDHSNVLKHGAVKQHTSKRTWAPRTSRRKHTCRDRRTWGALGGAERGRDRPGGSC